MVLSGFLTENGLLISKVSKLGDTTNIAEVDVLGLQMDVFLLCLTVLFILYSCSK